MVGLGVRFPAHSTCVSVHPAALVLSIAPGSILALFPFIILPAAAIYLVLGGLRPWALAPLLVVPVLVVGLVITTSVALSPPSQ